MMDEGLGAIEIAATIIVELKTLVDLVYAKFALLASFKDEFPLLDWKYIITQMEDPIVLIRELTSDHPIDALKDFMGENNILCKDDTYIEYKNKFDKLYNEHKGELIEVSPALITLTMLSNLINKGTVRNIVCIATDPYCKQDATDALDLLTHNGCRIQVYESDTMENWCKDNMDIIHTSHRLYTSTINPLRVIDSLWDNRFSCNLSVHIPDTKYNKTNYYEVDLRKTQMPAVSINRPQLKLYRLSYIM